MNFLVIGGTQFVGRAISAAILERGHDLTLFNRGRTNADLFPQAEKIFGDRDGDLDELNGRAWDVVIDTCGYVPRVVRKSVQKLADAVDRYVFISTISVYADMRRAGMTEAAPLGTLEDESTEEVTGETYGPLKVLCEQAAEETMPGRVLTIRPGLITGPHDHTDRFLYWPARIARGGDVLVPGRAERPIQHIDARDLAAWTVSMAERQATGIYNATGPAQRQTMGDLIDACQAVTDSEAAIYWVDEQFLLDNGVEAWQELPFWLPEVDKSHYGMMRIDCSKAIAAGLTFRPLVETVGDGLAWHRTREEHEWEKTLDPQKEAELLEKWQAK